MTPKKKKFPVVPLMVGLVLAIIAVGWYGNGPGGWFGGDEEDVIRGAEVRRGPLTISVTQRGNLEAKDSHVLRSQIQGRSTVLYLIPEGTMVKAGDLVAKLDASEQEDRKVSQEISVENARSNLAKAQQQLEIQKSQNTSDIAAADQRLTFADTDLKKYLQGDWPQQLQESEESIILAHEELAQSKDRLEWSRKLEKDGFLTRTELERDELSWQRSQILLEQAERRKTLLVDFDYPKQEAKLNADVEEAKRELERVKLQAKARLVDYEVAVSTWTSRLKLEDEKLTKLVDQIQNAEILAPADGMVVYGREEGGWGGRGGDPIQEGVEVRERQEIATIPRQDGMILEASLHESVLKKVQPGLPCIVKIEALPGREFEGIVDFVAHLPDKGSWWANPNLRVYRSEISILNTDEEMRPGMSCGVEIIVDEIPDTLFVPVQSVLYHKGKTICFVDDDGDMVERDIEVGQSSEKWVEVLSGLKEGEVVFLSPPADFVPEAAPEGEKPTAPRARPQGQGQGGGENRGAQYTADGDSNRGQEGQGKPEGAQAGWDPNMMKNMDPEKLKEWREKMKSMDPEKLKELRKQFSGQAGAGASQPQTSPGTDR